MQYKHGDIVLTKEGMLGILLVYHDTGNEYILELISSKARSGWNKNQDKKLVNYSSQALSEFWYTNLSGIEKKVNSYEEACSIINIIFNKELPTNFSLVDLFSTNVQDNIIKKGTCIVFTESLFNNTEYLKNYCYKQREDKYYFLSHLDSEGNRHNGWGLISPLKEGEKHLYAWRYATKEEHQRYEELGRPFDVTTELKQEIPKERFFNNKSKKDLEAMKDGEYYTCYKYGEKGNKYRFVFIYNKEISVLEERIHHKGILNVCHAVFRKEGTIHNKDFDQYIQKSTKEDIDWLNECIFQDSFVSKNKISEYLKIEDLKIGEYYSLHIFDNKEDRRIIKLASIDYGHNTPRLWYSSRLDIYKGETEFCDKTSYVHDDILPIFIKKASEKEKEMLLRNEKKYIDLGDLENNTIYVTSFIGDENNVKIIFQAKEFKNSKIYSHKSLEIRNGDTSYYSSSEINNEGYFSYIRKANKDEIKLLLEAYAKENSYKLSEVSASDRKLYDEIVSRTVNYLNKEASKSIPIIKTRDKENKLIKINAEVGQLLKTTTRTNKLFIIKI